MNMAKRSSRFGTLLALAATFVVQAETALTVNGVDIDSAVVNLYIESRIQKPANQATPDERATVIQELTDIYLLTSQSNAQELADDPQVKAQIELQGRAVLAQAVAVDFFAANPATDEEIIAEYEVQIQAAPALQFKARHILVETQAAAIDLITQLNEGADFAELARENSTGPTGPKGGDLGWFSPENMVKPFSDAVAAMEDGAYTSEPVQTQFGWHVIQREESRDNQPPTLESVRDTIKQRIEQNKFQAYLDGLRDDGPGEG